MVAKFRIKFPVNPCPRKTTLKVFIAITDQFKNQVKYVVPFNNVRCF